MIDDSVSGVFWVQDQEINVDCANLYANIHEDNWARYSCLTS